MRAFPADITSYDLLKTLAVVTMIIDHIGFYFFPDLEWWRVVGRLSAPMWLFLIGYARSRDFSPRLWTGAFVLLAGNVVTGMALIPVNILFTILMVRGTIDKIMALALSGKAKMNGLLLIGAALTFPTYFLWEYGSWAFMMAGFGYLVRHYQDGGGIPLATIKLAGGVTVVTHFLISFLLIAPDSFQLYFLLLGITSVIAGLYYFKFQTYPKLTAALPGFAAGLLKLGGRRTLEIYVAHLLLFKVMAVYLGMEDFGWFNFRLVDF